MPVKTTSAKGDHLKKSAAADSLTDSDTSRVIIVRLAVATHKALRVRVAEQDTSIQKWVEALIEGELGIRR